MKPARWGWTICWSKAVAEQVFELPSGCLCCVRRLDIVTTVRDLIAQRDTGAIGGFSRIVIETSGLADPAPILYTLAVDPMLGHLVTCQAVVTLVDAVAGQETLQRHPEAASQLAVADRILVTKTDLAPLTAELTALLDGLNGWAERIDSPSRMRAGGAAVREGAGGGKPAALRGADGRAGCRRTRPLSARSRSC